MELEIQKFDTFREEAIYLDEANIIRMISFSMP